MTTNPSKTVDEREKNELDRKYGKSAPFTDCFEGRIKLNSEFIFKDGVKRRLIHIEVRNMLVDLFRFDDGFEMFTGDINKYVERVPYVEELERKSVEEEK